MAAQRSAPPLAQAHHNQILWVNPPARPLTTAELDRVYALPYARQPHPRYAGQTLPAFEMIKRSVTIMRGCFGGCAFCALALHEGRQIQSRSQRAIVEEIAHLRDTDPTFNGVISDLGGPSANMYRMGCRNPEAFRRCQRPSCLVPKPCRHLDSDHRPLLQLYQAARDVDGVKKVLIGSGLRHDLALLAPAYIDTLVAHHVGGYLKVAPEHVSPEVLAAMRKPPIEALERFMERFDSASRAHGKKQFIIPYFIAAHPGATATDMLEVALWLKKRGMHVDQVQTFLPTPMSAATTIYHTGIDPLRPHTTDAAPIFVEKSASGRRLHKALLRYHDAENWPLLRDFLQRIGRTDLIGDGKWQLIPRWQPPGTGQRPEGRRRATRAPRTRDDHDPR